MDARDVLVSALGALGAGRRRTLLSLVGTSIGVAAVVVLTGLGEGAQRFVRAQFDLLGTDVVGVLPGKVETTGGIPGIGGVPNDLTLDDARAIQRAVPAAQHVAPMLLGNAPVSHGDLSRRVLIFGCTPEVLPVRDLDVRAGRFLELASWDHAEAEVVLGGGLARELFGTASPLGAKVRVGAWRMRVVGVLGSQGTHFGMDLDETAMVPVATAMRLFDQSSLFRVAVQLRPDADGAAAQERIRSLLIERHGEEDVTIVTPDAILAALGKLLDVLTLALVGIASISLAVAGIGVMNVMLVSVSERTAEIGLLKALGGTRRQILGLLLTEAVLMTGLGGLVGIALGWAALAGASLAWSAIPPTPPVWSAAAAFAVALGVGAVFGLLPAARAVKLDPVLALTRRRG
jgi:putative ABC transport system permease protein